MFIKQAFNYLHDSWRYVVGAIVIFLVSQLGAIPFALIATFKLMQEGGDITSLDDPATLMTVLDSNLTLFLMLLSFVFGLIAVVVVVKYLHKQPLVAATTSRKKVDWGRIWFSFLLIAITTIVLTVIDYYGNPDDYVVQFEAVPFIILAVIAILMIPLQTSFEEYLFRGYLMQGNTIMIYYIGTGFFLGIITLMDEGMELALGFHAGNNLIAALLVTADWTVFQTNSILKDISNPTAGFDILVPVLVMYPVFIGIMAWKYKWTNWSEKLFGKVTPPIKPSEEIIES